MAYLTPTYILLGVPPSIHSHTNAKHDISKTKKEKASHTRYRALGLELILVYRSAKR